MNKYTIYCTKAQTKKALELGAPLEFEDNAYPTSWRPNICRFERIPERTYHIPTAEQMIGWLEERGISIDIHTYFRVGHGNIRNYQYTVTDSIRLFNGDYTSRKEATLAAIDDALEYLSNNKK